MPKFINDIPIEFSKHYDKWNGCDACGLGSLATRHVLRPRGYIPCEILFIGMAPGLSEDARGWPMIGPTKDVLDEWIEESGVSALRWAIQNLIACMSREAERPAKYRDPSGYEIMKCRPRLIELVKLCAPGQIVLLGKLSQHVFPKEWFRECQYLDLPHPASVFRKEVRDPASISARAICELRRFAVGFNA